MSNGEKFPGDGVDFLNAQIAEAEAHAKATSTPEKESAAKINRDKKKRNKALAWGAIGTLAVGVTGLGIRGFAYGPAALAAMGPTVSTELSVDDAGSATVEVIDVTLPPITITSSLVSVEEFKVSTSKEMNTGWLGNIDISLDFLGKNGVERKADFTPKLLIDPGKVDITYDPAEEQMTFIVTDTAISSDIEIQPGAETTNKSQNLIDWAMPNDEIESLRQTIEGMTDWDTTDAPILREVAAGELKPYEAMEQFADESMAVEVDEVCIPLIAGHEGIEEYIKNNIRTVTQGKLLEKEFKPILDAIYGNPDTADRIDEILNGADVVLPEDFKNNITPDQERIDALKKYDEIPLLSAQGSEKPIDCKISDDVELIVENKEQE